jgi:predicted transcriptional regulator
MDIAAAILKIARDGAKKTNIMYNSLLSFVQLKEYLGLLIDNGLLKYSKDDSTYTTTEKGIRLLKMYDDVDGQDGA